MTTERKLSIAFFTDTYKPTINGVVTAVDLFATELRQLGHRVFIFGPRHPKQPREKDYYGLRSFPLPAAPDFRVGIPLSVKVIKQVPDLPIDIVHNHTPGPMGLLGLSLSQAKKVPLVQTYHSLISDYAKFYVPKVLYGIRRFIDWWQYFTYNRCDAITAPTPYIKQYLVQVGIKKQVTVLPTGLNLVEFSQPDMGSIRNFKLPDDKKIVACVSRMNKEKNLMFLVEMFSVLLERNPDTCLLMIGGGPFQKKLERKAAELNIQSSILFTGMCTRTQIAALLKKVDVFTYACRTDTQGIVIMEALAAGKPLVLVDEKVFEPFVDQGCNGYLLGEDHLLFAKVINNIITDPTLQKNMEQHSLLLSQKYSIQKMTAKLVSIYRDILNNPKGSN